MAVHILLFILLLGVYTTTIQHEILCSVLLQLFCELFLLNYLNYHLFLLLTATAHRRWKYPTLASLSPSCLYARAHLKPSMILFFSQAIKLFSISNLCVLTVMRITPSMLFVMRGRLEADRQLCFTNRPSGNKHYANHSPNESISPGLIQLENKCLHLTQHGGPGTGKMQFLNTQTDRHSLAYLQGKTICCDYWWTR